MTFDFGPFMQFIEASAQFTNAVMVAVLPHVVGFADKLELQSASDFNSNTITRVMLHPGASDINGSIGFSNGCVFDFWRGHIRSFQSGGAYSRERNPEAIPRYFAPVKMDKAEAISLARNTIRKLGYRLEDVFADLEPVVILPEKVGNNVIPFYTVKWPQPHGGDAATVEINGSKKSVERINFLGPNLDRPPFKVGVVPATRPDHPFFGKFTGINPEYGYKLFPIVLREVTNYAARLGIDLPSPLTTNHLKRFWVEDNGGWPHSELELTNGIRFLYRNTNVVGYFSADDFFSVAAEKRKAVLADLQGHWRMTDAEMIKLARQTLARLGYPKEFVHTKGKPKLTKPTGQFEKLIPRCQVEWMHPNPADMSQWSYVEIDAEKKRVTAVYLDDQSFRAQTPPIDVPISLKPPRTLNPNKERIHNVPSKNAKPGP